MSRGRRERRTNTFFLNGVLAAAGFNLSSSDTFSYSELAAATDNSLYLALKNLLGEHCGSNDVF